MAAASTVTLSMDALDAEMTCVRQRPLQGSGWGSMHATHLVLNNLMYHTAKVSGLL